MKKYYLRFFVLISSFGYTQNTHDITKVVQSDLSAKQLFVNARYYCDIIYRFNKELEDDIIAYGRSNLQVSSNEFSYTSDKNFSNTSMIF